MLNYDNVPEWIRQVTDSPKSDDPIWTIEKVREVVTQLNFLKGAYVGHAAKIDELEQKLDIAFEYQREVDARKMEAYGYGAEAAKLIREG